MSTCVSLPELLNAFEWVSAVGPFENVAYVSRESGQIWLVSDFDDAGDEPPENADDDSLYLQVPSRKELDLGRSLAIEFTEKELPDCSGEVRAFFSKAGAYAKFKNLLAERSVLEDWYVYEASGVQKALRGWAAANDVELLEEAA
jgi:hypothetical protein